MSQNLFPKPYISDGRKIWTITNREKQDSVNNLILNNTELGSFTPGCRIVKRTLQDGLSAGVEIIEINNGMLSFVVVPTRGMGIWNAHCRGVRLGWDSPVKGPVHPAFVRLDEPDGLGWLAAFDEMLVRCGLEYNGGPEFHENGTLRYGLHGRIANTPAHKVEISVDQVTGRIAVTGVVDESRLFGNKLRLTSTISTFPGTAEIAIHDTVTNLSSEPGELELIYHTNFGTPLLGAGAEIIAPVKKVEPYDEISRKTLNRWNIMSEPTAGAREECFFCDLNTNEEGSTGVMLCSADRSKAVHYRFNKEQLPYFTLWKNSQCASDGYAIGFEPGTNLPNTKTEEKKQGRVIMLAPNESRKIELQLRYLDDENEIDKAIKSLKSIV